MVNKIPPKSGKILKRQRVTAACEKCRDLKAKCDGRKPRCGRCAGYGYECTWTSGKRNKSNEEANRQIINPSFSHLLNPSILRKPFDLLYPVLQFVKPQLDPTDQEKLEEVCRRMSSPRGPDQETQSPSPKSAKTAPVEQGYLGEASEGDFIRTIRQDLADSQSPQVNPETVDLSYVQEDAIVMSMIPVTKTEGMRYMHIFTSTIGIAYSFVPLDQLHDAVSRWTDDPQNNTLSTNWQSLVLAVFAIGACYETLSDEKSDQTAPSVSTKDRQLFRQSFELTAAYDCSRNLERSWARLAHCFYLLATSQVDRCWTNLGQVVRLAHGIGLHTEWSSTNNQIDGDIEREQRRTTWYCIFILDHLLALQLGRPPATYTPFFSVKLPSNVMAIQNNNSDLQSFFMDQTPHEREEAIREYHLAMVDLSNVIEEVMQTLYNSRDSTLAERSAIIIRLDQRLLQWKAALPRRLRFDVGHTFETSSIHKRHRNFLATKFHHLRALIHRPLLSYLKRTATMPMAARSIATLPPDVRYSISTCIGSAQNTARLLYNIKNIEDVVYNFPWWQMISCLLCASSILLVAIMDRKLSTKVDTQAIEEDVDICLAVFNALSVNSKAAEAALDLMKKLRDTGSELRSEPMAGSTAHIENGSTQPGWYVDSLPTIIGTDGVPTPAEMTMVCGSSADATGIPTTGMDYNFFDFDNNSMPDSLMWSTQFISDEFHPLGNMIEFAGQ